MENNQNNLRVLAVVAFVLLPLLAFAGPKEQVAVAEAFVWAAQNQRPALPSDTFQAKPLVPIPEDPKVTINVIGEPVDVTETAEPVVVPQSPIAAKADRLSVENSELSESLRRSLTELDLARAELAEAKTTLQSKAWEVAELKVSKSAPVATVTPPSGVATVSPKPMTMTVVQTVMATASNPVEVTVHTAEWCQPCKLMQSENGNGDQRVHFTYTDDPPPKIARLRGNRYYMEDPGLIPVSTWIDGKGGMRYLLGKKSTEQIWRAIIDEANDPPVTLPFESTGPAGAIHASNQIREVLNWWKAHIGQGNKAQFRWDRSGAQAFPLLAKGDWSATALFGRYGHVELNSPNAVGLPIHELGFGYKVSGDDISIDLDAVTLVGIAKQLDPESVQSYGIGGPDPVKFDPMTAWTVFVILRDIWSLLHPSCDLQLGGNVSATAVLNGDMLAIDFEQAPSIKLVALFTFNLAVNRLEITEQSVRVVFGGSKLVKERTFVVSE